MEAAGFAFEVVASNAEARVGRLHTPHGVVDTPAFMSVATYGAVRGISPDELRGIGAQILLANTYHLHERPGEDVVAELGGLHGFTGWQGPWLTDSGGYQVTSLAHRVSLGEEGVTFSSPLDGQKRHLTPEAAIEIQEALGPDIAMVLDECLPIRDGEHDTSETRLEAAMERTLRWAARSLLARRRRDQAVFGIVQGGASLALRQRSARGTHDLGFDGYAHGGLGLGEERELRRDLIATVNAELPSTSPRYLMGLGRPEDLIVAVACGIDLFDCVVPTRHGRHGVLFTSQGVLAAKAARFARDDGPPDPACDCPLCSHHSRGYLRHLLRGGEALGSRLASLHNLRFTLRLLERAREAINQGQLATLHREVLELADTRV